jgi:hypothetical protein
VISTGQEALPLLLTSVNPKRQSTSSPGKRGNQKLIPPSMGPIKQVAKARSQASKALKSGHEGRSDQAKSMDSSKTSRAS